MLGMGNIRFVDLTTVDGKGSARSKHLSLADHRHVRLATIENAQRKRRAQNVKAQQGYESQFLLTTTNNETEAVSEVSIPILSLNRASSAKTKERTQNFHNSPAWHFDRLTLKSDNSLDEAYTIP